MAWIDEWKREAFPVRVSTWAVKSFLQPPAWWIGASNACRGRVHRDHTEQREQDRRPSFPTGCAPSRSPAIQPASSPWEQSWLSGPDCAAGSSRVERLWRRQLCLFCLADVVAGRPPLLQSSCTPSPLHGITSLSRCRIKAVARILLSSIAAVSSLRTWLFGPAARAISKSWSTDGVWICPEIRARKHHINYTN